MKKITKGGQPEELLKWRAENNGIPENIVYGLSGFPRAAVLSTLLIEQGYICAYTLLSITENKAHVEHLKPRATCKDEDEECKHKGAKPLYEDVEWVNMVACFPQPYAKHPGYGAWQKDNWWCSQNFVSPVAENCESRFRYSNDGSIRIAVDGDIPAHTTIKKLKLDLKPIEELRFKAIKATGFHKRSTNPILSIKAVERMIDKLKQKRNGRYDQFCTVLEHVGIEYLGELKKRTSRKRYNAKAKVKR